MDGRSYISRDWNKTWSETVLPKNAIWNRGGPWFFDEKRWLVPGRGEADEPSILLVTEDGGLNWTPISPPSKGELGPAQLSKDGAIRVVGDSGSLLSSSDFGRSWIATSNPFGSEVRRLGLPEPGISSFCCTGDEWYAGSNLNGLKRTSDGGKTWSSLPTPVDELCPENPDREEDEADESRPITGKDGKSRWRPWWGDRLSDVSYVWVFGDHLLAIQCHQLFAHALSTDGGWKLVEVEGHAVELAALDGERLAVVTDDGRIAHLSKELRPLSTSPPIVPERRRAIAVSSKGVAVLAGVVGQVCSVCTWTEGKLDCSRLHSAGRSREWKIDSFDRARDGTLYGVTASALYSSRDSGKSWDLLAEGEYMSSVHVRSDGNSVLVRDEGGWFTWARDQPRLAPLGPGEYPPGNSSVVARKGQLWISKGFEAAKDKDTQRMLRSSDTVLVGPNFTATVFASVDDGRSWKSIDRYVGAIVHALWLGADNTLSLCMSDGAIRRGKLVPETGALAGGGMQRVSAEGAYLGGQWASWIVFPEPEIGLVGGHHYFGGIDTDHSEDGGRTWQGADTVEDRYIDTFLLGGGGCLRMVGAYGQPCRIEIWRGGKFEKVCSPEFGPHDAHIDSIGALLVRLVNGDVWCLDRDGRDWKKIARIEFPAD